MLPDTHVIYSVHVCTLYSSSIVRLIRIPMLDINIIRGTSFKYDFRYNFKGVGGVPPS